jgi:hypothetical protein
MFRERHKKRVDLDNVCFLHERRSFFFFRLGLVVDDVGLGAVVVLVVVLDLGLSDVGFYLFCDYSPLLRLEVVHTMDRRILKKTLIKSFRSNSC